MKFRPLLLLPILLSPVAALAQDGETCELLYRQLNNGTQVIGNTQDVRNFAQSLSRLNADIRGLRIELRRSGCGGGSIVVLGGSDPAHCEAIRTDLDAWETERDALIARRDDARRLIRPSADRAAIVDAIRREGCPIDPGAPLTPATSLSANPSETRPSDTRLSGPDRLTVPGIELPAGDEPYSGITDLRSRTRSQTAGQAAAAPVTPSPPDRPYDASRKVRSVGPQFLPEPDIDLANPADHGAQKTQ